MKKRYSLLILSSLLLGSISLVNLTSCSNNEIKETLKSIEVDKEEINLEIGSKEVIKITTDPVNYDLSKLKFSFDKSIINFNTSTLEITGLKQGETELVISGSNNVSKTIKVVVNDILATSIDSSFSRKIIGINEEIQIDVTFSPSNVTNKELQYTSSNTSVLSVSETGLIKGLTSGTSTLTISYPANSKVSELSYEIKVSNKEYEVDNDKYLGEVGVARVNESKDINSGNFTYKIKRKSTTEQTFTNSFNIYNDHIYNNITNFNNESYTLYYGKDDKYLYTVNKSSEKTNKSYQKIGDDYNDLSLDEANKMTNMMAFYYDTYVSKYTYGIGEYLQNEIIDGVFLNTYSAPYTSISVDNNKVLLALNKKTTTTKETYRLSISFDKDNFKEIIYDHSVYNEDDLDDNFNIVNDATPYEYHRLNLNYEVGEKVKEDNPSINYNNFYFSDFDVTFRNNSTDEVGTTFYLNDTIVYDVTNFLPSDASTSIDRVEIINSSNPDVLRISENKLCLMADSVGESVVTLKSKNVTKEYTLKVIYKDAIGVSFSSDFKETIASNESMTFKVSVNPSGAQDDLVVALKSDSTSFATLTKNTYGSYTLKPIKEAITETRKVTLLITSEANPKLNTEKVVTIIKELTDAEIRTILTSNNFIGTISGSYLNKVVVTFKEEETTNVGTVDIYSGSKVYDSFNFKYVINKGKINLTGVSYSKNGYFTDLSITLDNKDISSFKLQFVYESEDYGDETYEYRCYKESK